MNKFLKKFFTTAISSLMVLSIACLPLKALKVNSEDDPIFMPINPVFREINTDMSPSDVFDVVFISLFLHSYSYNEAIKFHAQILDENAESTVIDTKVEFKDLINFVLNYCNNLKSIIEDPQNTLGVIKKAEICLEKANLWLEAFKFGMISSVVINKESLEIPEHIEKYYEILGLNIENKRTEQIFRQYFYIFEGQI